MVAIVAYGSLINQERHQGSHLFTAACPVLVKGYRRVFSQEPSWRQGDRTYRAVLNVVKSDEDYFNGLLVGLRDNSSFDEIDEREQGYDRVVIASSQLTDFAKVSGAIAASPTYIYLGKPEKQNDNILPNKSYVELCLCGAKHWGKEFYAQFLQTTYVGKHTLETFLQTEAFLSLEAQS